MASHPLKSLATLAAALLSAGAAHAAEMLVMPPGATPLARLPMDNRQAWFDAVRDLPNSQAHDGLLVSFPVELASRDCSPGKTVTLFRVEPVEPEPTFLADDPRGLTHLFLDYSPSEGILSVRVQASPIVDGVRLTQPVDYSFKILDRFAAPGAFCGKSIAAGAYRFNLYLNKSSFVVEAVPFVGGLSQVYLSPVNMGLGDYLWNSLVDANDKVMISGEPGVRLDEVVTRPNMEVRLYGLNWTSGNGPHPPSDPALYNVKDSVNYQFGAKAYPTASPTLRLPRAAAVLLTAP